MASLEDALFSRHEASAEPPFTFHFSDLSSLMADDLDPPALLLPGLLYEGASHWFSGHPKHGKTVLVMHAAITLIEKGHHVIWLDYEGGPRRTARRLREMNALPSAVAEFFHYEYAPHTTTQPKVIAAFEQTIDQWPGALVVFDSQAKALRRAGFSEDSADEVTEWTQNLVLNLTNVKHATVAVIDHMVKSGGRESRYARGSGAKAADADVSWFVEKAEEFNRNTRGRIECSLWHDRDGCLPERLAYAVGDGDGGLPVTSVDPYPIEPEKPEPGARSI